MKRRLRLQLPWRTALPFIAGGIIIVGLLTFRLVSLAARLSPSEQATLNASHSLHVIADNPLFAPMKLLVWLAHFAPSQLQIFAARLPSVILALGAIAAMVFILLRWYGRRSAIFGFMLFASSAAYLHVARFAGFDIMYLAAMLALLAAHVIISDHEDSVIAWFAWLAINVLLLFVPGMILFVVLSAAWQWRAIVHAVRGLHAWQQAISVTVTVLGLGAIIQAIVRNHAVGFRWLGIPSQLDAFKGAPHALLTTVQTVAYQSAPHPEQWLGRLPLLDIFTLFMAFVGLVFYARHWRASRTRMLASYLVLGIILVSLGTVSISVIVPLLYILAVGGIAYTLFFWLRKFPRNPVARYAGIVIVATITALACYYNLVHYFVAWPRNPETAIVYRAKK